MTIPEGFRRLPIGGDFVELVGPLYLRHEGELLLLGMRIEKRHTNPMGICHGGMLATFCDMLLPISIHRKSSVGMRFVPTISLQLDYLAPARLGNWLQGEAQILRVTKTMVFAQGLVSADDVPSVRVSGVFKIGPPIEHRPEIAG